MRFFRDEKGNVTILVTVVLLALMGVMALVIDMGVVYAEKVKLVNAIDAAILAGGQELPDDKLKARQVMEEYLIVNEVSLEDVSIAIAYDGMSAEIIGTKNVEHYFAQLIGFDSSDITENTKIVLGAASSATGGLRPFAVEKFPYAFGDEVTLKVGAGDGYHGNYGAVALGGTGTSLLLENALFGYAGSVSIGEFVDTEPGNMANVVNELKFYIDSINDTFETYDDSSDKLWTIPLVDTLLLDGRDSVEVIGFAQVYVHQVSKIKGQAVISAKFVQFVTSGEIGETVEDTGVYAMKLVD